MMNPQFNFNLTSNPVDNNSVGMFESAITLMKCRECNTFFNAVHSELVDHCFYCNSKDVYSAGVVNSFKDYSIIPFEKDISFAMKEYKKKVVSNPAIPKIFKKQETIQTMSKLFIPCKLYQVRSSGSIVFSGKNYSINKDYQNIVIPAYTNLENSFSVIHDYDVSKLTSFTNDYLKDCVYIEANMEQEVLNKKVQEEIMNRTVLDIHKEVKAPVNKMDTTNLGVTITNEKNILVPIYLLNVKYDDQSYLYVMNGCSGKSSFKHPIEKRKISKIILLIAIVIILLVIFL